MLAQSTDTVVTAVDGVLISEYRVSLRRGRVRDVMSGDPSGQRARCHGGNGTGWGRPPAATAPGLHPALELPGKRGQLRILVAERCFDVCACLG